MENTVKLYAHGKLLLTGEYLVLKGARALAFPVCYGQSLTVSPLDKTVIEWNSYDPSGLWFQASFNLADYSFQSKQPVIAEFARKLLTEIQALSPSFLSDGHGYIFDFNLNYPREWGFGSSSTLIWLMSAFASVDSFQLYHKLSKGSGYDLACSSRSSPFFYTLKSDIQYIEKAEIGRALQEHSCFAYLGNKQDTFIEVNRFLDMESSFSKEIDSINKLSRAIGEEDDVLQLCPLIREHESILSGILHQEPLAKQFPDFPGAIKSLGAWGGDFALFVSSYPTDKIKIILKDYGLNTIFTFDELKLSF